MALEKQVAALTSRLLALENAGTPSAGNTTTSTAKPTRKSKNRK